MKNKDKLVNVLILTTATYFLKKWLLDDNKKEVVKNTELEEKQSLLERKKEQLIDLFS